LYQIVTDDNQTMNDVHKMAVFSAPWISISLDIYFPRNKALQRLCVVNPRVQYKNKIVFLIN
jgi:hypothetical protein